MTTPVERVTAFFHEQLPNLIERQRELFATSRGSLGVIVEGAGSWTITFGDADSDDALTDEVDVEADCLAIWTVPAFVAVLDGNAEKPAAIVGDERLLGRLGTLMLPTQKGALGGRLTFEAQPAATDDVDPSAPPKKPEPRSSKPSAARARAAALKKE